MAQQMGRQSLQFENPPWIISSGCIAGTKEGEGPIGHEIDLIGEDDNFGCDIWEEAESTLQKEALTLALGKAGLRAEELRYLFAGDLLAQGIATSYGIMELQIPLFGLYGACSTCGESLGLASITVAGGAADCVMALTSSHFASAEKEFRFPLEYAGQRPLSTTWTVTGSGAFVIAAEEHPCSTQAHCCISGITTGKVVDYGIKDSMHMGAAMAPAALLLCWNRSRSTMKAPP